mgnify:CR=1 FL=1
MQVNAISFNSNYKQTSPRRIFTGEQVATKQNQDVSQFKSTLKINKTPEVIVSPAKTLIAKLQKAFNNFFKPTFNPDGTTDFADIDLYSRIFMY